MDQDLVFIADNLLELGVGILAKAQRDILYGDTEAQVDESVLGVLQAAQAGELIIKAAIAKQHPLLIFSSIPKSNTVCGDQLSIRDVVENSKPLEYSELPEKLWATTGFKITDLKAYNSFGRLRNSIHYFGVLERDIRIETANYIYNVIDPVLGHFWDDYAINHIDGLEAEEDIIYLLTQRGVTARYPYAPKINSI